MASSEQRRRLDDLFEFPRTVEYVEGSGPRNMVVRHALNEVDAPADQLQRLGLS